MKKIFILYFLFFIETFALNTNADSIHQIKILPPSINQNMLFGYSVLMNNRFFAVGSPGDLAEGKNCGSVYLYTYFDTNYQFIQKLIPPNPDNNDKFGSSLCFSEFWLNELYLFVGAPNKLLSNRRSGAVYVYKLVDSIFIYIKTLTPLNPADGDGFGYSISSSSDYLIIGAPYKKYNDTACGAIFLYKYMFNDWAYRQFLFAPDRVTNQRFGFSVAVRSNRFSIGAPGDKTFGNNSGAVYDYFFNNDNGLWSLNIKKFSPAPKAGDEFGFSLTRGIGAGELLVVGAPGIDDFAVDAGKIFVYSLNGYSFVLITAISALDPQNEDRLGSSVSAKIYNTNFLRIYTGAPGRKTIPHLQTGCTFLMWADNYNGGQSFKIFPQSLFGYDNYGFSVTIAGDHFIAGAPNQSESGLNVGCIFFNKFIPAVPIPVELGSLNSYYSEGKVSLNWTTVSELNNLGFEIERSLDKENWYSIGFVKGSGTSTIMKNYFFVDEIFGLFNEKIFYRLKQIDYNGKFIYSSISEVDIITSSFELKQNFPNPFNEETSIRYILAEKNYAKLKVYNFIGQEITSLDEGERERGIYDIKFDASFLSSGIYLYKLELIGDMNSPVFTKTRKMLLMK